MGLKELLVIERAALEVFTTHKELASELNACPSWKFWKKRKLQNQWENAIFDAKRKKINELKNDIYNTVTKAQMTTPKEVKR